MKTRASQSRSTPHPNTLPMRKAHVPRTAFHALIRLWAWGVLVAALPRDARASKGFNLIENDAEAAAMHGGAAALVSNPAAARINPANLALLREPAAQSTTAYYYTYGDFTDLAGNTIRSEKPNKFAGSFFASVPITGTATFGFGVENSYGSSVFWPKEGPFKYFTAHEGQLKYFDFTPSIGVRVSDSFRFGATLNVAYAQLSLSQLYPWAALTRNPATPDGEMEFECDDVGLGGTIGMSWDVTPRHHLAFVARTPIHFRFEGDYEITKIPFPIQGVTRRSDLQAQLDIPAELTLSYAWDVTQKLTLGAEFSYIFNSAVEDFRIDVGGNNVLFPSTTTRLGWHDSIAASLGGKYRLTPQLSLLAGYQYTESPMEEKTYTPLIPGIDRHLVSAGVAYERGPVALKLAFSKGFFPDLEIRSNTVSAFNGTHSLELNVVTMSCAMKF